MSGYKNKKQAIKFLGITSSEFEDVLKLGLLRMIELGGVLVVSETDLLACKRWIERQETPTPLPSILSITARIHAIEQQLQALVQVIQPPYNIIVNGLEDTQLKQLVFDILSADTIIPVDAERWLGMLCGVNWDVLNRVRKLTGTNPPWKPFAELLIKISAWWESNSGRNLNSDKFYKARISLLISKAKKNLRDLILLQSDMDISRFLDEHPRRIVAAMLTIN